MSTRPILPPRSGHAGGVEVSEGTPPDLEQIMRGYPDTHTVDGRVCTLREDRAYVDAHRVTGRGFHGDLVTAELADRDAIRAVRRMREEDDRASSALTYPAPRPHGYVMEFLVGHHWWRPEAGIVHATLEEVYAEMALHPGRMVRPVGVGPWARAVH